MSNMEDLAVRLENATVNMSRILAERKGDMGILRYLKPEDREFVARKTMEQHLERERMELQRLRCNDMLGRYQILVDLGVELDVVTKTEIRQYVSCLARDDFGCWVEDAPRVRGRKIVENVGNVENIENVVPQVQTQDSQPCPGCDNCVY